MQDSNLRPPACKEERSYFLLIAADFCQCQKVRICKGFAEGITAANYCDFLPRVPGKVPGIEVSCFGTMSPQMKSPRSASLIMGCFIRFLGCPPPVLRVEFSLYPQFWAKIGTTHRPRESLESLN